MTPEELADECLRLPLLPNGKTNYVDCDSYLVPMNLSRRIIEAIEKGIAEERQRILAIIEKEPWEVYGDDYYQTYDAQASIAKLKALIEKETPS